MSTPIRIKVPDDKKAISLRVPDDQKKLAMRLPDPPPDTGFIIEFT